MPASLIYHETEIWSPYLIEHNYIRLGEEGWTRSTFSYEIINWLRLEIIDLLYCIYVLESSQNFVENNIGILLAK